MRDETNSLQQVVNFFDAASDDGRINVYHISLYLALVYIRDMADSQNPITVYRTQGMKLSRMSRRMYNRSMKDLAAFGYLNYEYSTDPASGSKVYFKKL